MHQWTTGEIRAHLEAQDDPDLAAFLAELTSADRQAAGLSWFARMVAQARPKWHKDALGLEAHPGVDWFATHRAKQAEAVEVCRRCLVADECLAFALEHGEVGVWGATTEHERRIRRGDQAA